MNNNNEKITLSKHLKQLKTLGKGFIKHPIKFIQVVSESVDENKKELAAKEARERVEARKAYINKQKAKKEARMSELKSNPVGSLDDRMSRIEKKLDTILSRIYKLEDEIESLGTNAAAATEKFDKFKRDFKDTHGLDEDY